MNDQVNNQCSTDTDGKSGNIDDRENFISPKISNSNKEIIFEHVLSLAHKISK